MASAMIHIAVANEINKVLKMDQRKLLIGSIAPDMGKLIGRDKSITHFVDDDSPDIPNMDLFLKKGRYFHEYFKAPAYEIIEGIGNPRKYNGEYLLSDLLQLHHRSIQPSKIQMQLPYTE